MSEMFSRLDRIQACDRQTDRHCQTDILPQHSLCYAHASRDRNDRSADIVMPTPQTQTFAMLLSNQKKICFTFIHS